MERLFRFVVLMLMFVLIATIMYVALPVLLGTFSWNYGITVDILSDPIYASFAGALILILLGIVFNDCFNSNFFSKKLR